MGTKKVETLTHWQGPYLHLACDRCPRYGRYRVDRLIAEFGTDVHLGILRRRLVGRCPQHSCGAYYVNSAADAILEAAESRRPMTVGQLQALLARHPPGTPVVLSAKGLVRARRVRIFAVDDGDPPQPSRDGTACVLITGD